jgi:methylmalonyl-CoA/ethylmalonyl-CoA epimerase
MGLLQVAQHAEDLDRAVAFYRDTLGLPFIARFDPPGLAFLDLGNTRLLLEANAPTAVLYLEVGDIEAAHRRLLDAGVDTIGEPHLIHTDNAGDFGPAGNETWMTFFHDTEGNTLAYVESRAG